MKTPQLLLALMCLYAAPLPARAVPELCESAAVAAAREANVPVDVLLAIALTESGRQAQGRLRPWPWTANAEGRGYWFDTRQEAADFAHRLLARGQRLFDLGCFQINWYWHGENFTRPDDLLDPLTAARYAARLLATLHDEFGSWEGAAGAYHSRNPQFADRYRTRFSTLRAGLSGSAPTIPDPPSVRVNTFPLLADALTQGASLVPLALPAARPLFEAAP
ncbi:transglycosylase SLT domain-containing protein [Pararhodobacter zhoushanensis]|uniref:transglycosylase SLT domain-containing protein n=1 Tax=Pararhodobacter zhoushanensis TaxID=2479545 RepID=UPI001FEC7CA8|nr:transglycosylase SLT domain-containing protein [Pararhodobacter zhoushanensis]